MILGNDHVAVTFTPEGWTARWRGGPEMGPVTTAVELDHDVLAAPVVGAAWTRFPGEAIGRDGTWGTTTTPDGVQLAVHVAHDDGVLAVEVAFAGTGRARLRRFHPVRGTVGVAAETGARLVNGYQSWDYSGVRPATEPGTTWWGGAIADRASGVGVAVHAATAVTFATSVATEPAVSGVAIDVMCGGAPDLVPVAGSWGFRPSGATALDRPLIGASRRSELVLLAGGDAAACMEEVARLAGVAMGERRWDGPPITGWESWYHYGTSVTPDVVLANASLLRARFGGRRGFDMVQIDDGWQRAYGDWQPCDAWPADLGEVCEALRALDCRPGLWLAPFMVTPDAPGIGQRRDVLIGHASGRPLRDPLMGRHGVDASHPAAVEWLTDLGDQVRRWGFDMVKLDFLYIGAQEGVRHDPDVTGTQALRAGLAAFVDAVGPDVYVLGCGMPMLPAVGLCHGNRIGGDLAAPVIWPDDLPGPFDPSDPFSGVRPQARNAASRWWMHRTLFDNDPDVVMAYNFTPGQTQALAALAACTGGPYLLADDLAAVDDVHRAALEDPAMLDLAWSDGFRPLDLWQAIDDVADYQYYSHSTGIPSMWMLRRSGLPSARVACRFDWAAGGVTIEGS